MFEEVRSKKAVTKRRFHGYFVFIAFFLNFLLALIQNPDNEMKGNEKKGFSLFEKMTGILHFYRTHIRASYLLFHTNRKRSGVNFTNILQAAFTREDPKSAIKLLNNCQSLLTPGIVVDIVLS